MRLIDADALKYKQQVMYKKGDSDEVFAEWFITATEINNAPTIDAVPQWIPCKERLPELDEICLVTEKDGSIRHCYFDSVDPVLFATFEEGMYVRNVIAWMPLPEPYKEEQHG